MRKIYKTITIIFAVILHISCLAVIDSRIKNYVYNESEVYKLTVSVGYQSSVEFAPGEKIQTISLGDSYALSITPIDSRIIIKPLENDIKTNMIVITNLRTYNFDVVSKLNDDKSTNISYITRFYYPNVQNLDG